MTHIFEIHHHLTFCKYILHTLLQYTKLSFLEMSVVLNNAIKILSKRFSS